MPLAVGYLISNHSSTMYPLPFAMKQRLQESLDDPNEQHRESLSNTITTVNNEGDAMTKDDAQSNVPSKPSPPTLQQELPEEVDPVPDIASLLSAQTSSVPDSFAPLQGFASTAGNYHFSIVTNPQYPMASDASLMTQPLITTPGGMQLSALLGGEKPIEFRPGFTPRTTFAQGHFHPGQSSVITNRTHRSNSPMPFPPPSIGSSYSYGNSSFGRDVMSGFDFSGFTPIIAPPPSTSTNGTQEQQEMSIPSPMYTLSSQQMAALEYMSGLNNNTRRSTTPVPPFGPRTKKTAEEVVKANKTKKKQARLTQRSQQMDASVVMTMNVTTQPCKCPKNQCIKLYCECFHRGQICDPSECNCTKCLNTLAESTPNGVRTKRVKDILARKGIDAFKVKPKKTGVGCSCKKSR